MPLNDTTARRTGTGTASVEPETPEGWPSHRRRVQFNWERTPLHWVPDDPFATHMINVLHLLLPTGERWFVEVVNEATPLVDDPKLLEAIRPFVRQEAWHAYAHQQVLKHLADQGLDPKPFIERLDGYFRTVLADHPRWPRFAQRWWLHRRLALVAAIEHYTCVLGKWILENNELERNGADPTMLDLLRWHGAEEVEHRSLVWDVHDNVSGSHLQRVTAMLEVSVMLTLRWLQGVHYLMTHDPTLGGRKPRLRDWLRSARAGHVPSPAYLAAAMPRYLRRRHHPSQEATTAWALQYLAQSPAASTAPSD